MLEFVVTLPLRSVVLIFVETDVDVLARLEWVVIHYICELLEILTKVAFTLGFNELAALDIFWNIE